MLWRLALALALVGASGSLAAATVWQRARPDGTIEFTNVAPAGKTWKALNMGLAAPRFEPEESVGARPTARGAVWTRESRDGTLEFTNVKPVGARWKVLFRTGPGKAAALRGRSDVVPARDLSAARFHRFDQHIHDQQALYGIPPALLRAIIKTESDFDPRVVSSAGAMGLMQLMPGTARAMGVGDVWDPRQNIMGGARYLQLLARRFCRTPAGTGSGGIGGGFVCSFEEKVKVVAGYHAGPGAVEKYGGLPPYETTRSYVTTVLRRYEDHRRMGVALSPLAAAP